MSQTGEFKIFQRGDGSQVAVQVSRILYVAKGDHGSILNFGAGTQLNVRQPFEEVVALLGGSAGDEG
jgi:hypothetical protein